MFLHYLDKKEIKTYKGNSNIKEYHIKYMYSCNYEVASVHFHFLYLHISLTIRYLHKINFSFQERLFY